MTHSPTPEQRTLLDKLADISRQIAGHEAALMMLQMAKLQAQHELRALGYRPPRPEVDE